MATVQGLLKGKKSCNRNKIIKIGRLLKRFDIVNVATFPQILFTKQHIKSYLQKMNSCCK